jgi:hypothetical protein
MKNLLMMLVLANALYFMWDRYGDKAEEVGIAIVEENRLGPRLKLGEARVAEVATEITTEFDTGRVTDLAAVVGQSCVSISFRNSAEAGSALTDYRNAGMRASQRTAPGSVFIGNWVQIRNIPDRDLGNEMLATLKQGGISDVILLQDNGAYKISLGLFGEASGVERMELQARSLGMEPEIIPEIRDAMLYYVDIALPPGRGAGAMIEQYGEDRVLLRDRASCPNSG